PSDGSDGVVSVFAIATRPDSSSIRVASVKVPPMSIAIRTLKSQVSCRDSVHLECALGADLSLAHVAAHELRIALVRRAVTAAATRADAARVAGLDIDRDARAAPRLAAGTHEHVLGASRAAPT